MTKAWPRRLFVILESAGLGALFAIVVSLIVNGKVYLYPTLISAGAFGFLAIAILIAHLLLGGDK